MALTDQHPLRKVAVLVASLDEPWASRVLGKLPAATAQAVAEAALDLGPLDPHEQREIVKDFRRSMASELLPGTGPAARPGAPTTSATGGVELDASLLAHLDSQECDAGESEFGDSRRPSASQASSAIGDADAKTLAHLLGTEHPQTIAVVLSRLEDDRAVDILARLSNRLQAEVLGRMADLDTADPQTLQVVESQLAQWIDQQQQQKRRMAVGVDLVRRILSRAPRAERDTILTTISQLKPELSRRLQNAAPPTAGPAGQPASSQAIGYQGEDPEAASPRAGAAAASLPYDFAASPISATPAVARAASPRHTRSHVQRAHVQRAHVQRGEPPRGLPTGDSTEITPANAMAHLERADDAKLLAALSQADRRTSMLALAGASEALLKRILRGMPRRQARKFRQQVCTIPPTRLSEMLAAQQHLAQLVHQM